MSDPALHQTSVVIPCYNAAPYVPAAIDSCLAEGIAGQNIIVVDDGSNDNSAAVISSHNPAVRLVQKPNGGASTARNAGLAQAQTEFVIFLDADDIYEGGILSALAEKMMSQMADLGLGCTQVVRNGALGPRKTPPPVADVQAFIEAWLAGRTVQTNSYMWRTDFLRGIGGWREDMKTLEEIEIVLRAVLKGAQLTTSLIGHSRYNDQGNTDRVSYGNSKSVIQSAVEGFAALESSLQTPGQRRAAGQRYYQQARAAFRHGYPELGRDALARARRCGFGGHVGTRGHRIMASLIGLEMKEALMRRRT